jgi:hypothetical protein
LKEDFLKNLVIMTYIKNKNIVNVYIIYYIFKNLYLMYKYNIIIQYLKSESIYIYIYISIIKIYHNTNYVFYTYLMYGIIKQLT